MLRMNAEIQEKGCVSVISRLNSKKGLATEIVRAVKEENIVWLIFSQGKKTAKKQCTRDLYGG